MIRAAVVVLSYSLRPKVKNATGFIEYGYLISHMLQFLFTFLAASYILPLN